MKKFLSVVLAAVMVLSLAACGGSGSSTSSSSTEPIKLGFIAPLSGANAAVGTSNLSGVQLAVDEINAAGGIKGRQIELVSYDDENDASKAVGVCNKLIQQDEVVSIVGSTNSSVTLGAMTVTQDAQIPEFTPNSSGASITNSGYKYIVRVQLNDLKMARACVEYAVDKRGFKNIALMYQDDDYGRGGEEVVVDVLAEKGMKLVADEAFDPKSDDMNAQLVKVKAGNPDCLIMWCMYTPGATIATQARQLGINCQLMGGGGLTNAKLYELGGDNVVGVINTQPFLAGADAINDFSSKFIENYKAANGKVPDSNVAMAYDCVYSFKYAAEYALDKYGDLSGDHLMEGMHTMKDYPLATGNMTCAENGDLDRDAMLLVQLNADGSYSVAK